MKKKKKMKNAGKCCKEIKGPYGPNLIIKK